MQSAEEMSISFLPLAVKVNKNYGVAFLRPVVIPKDVFLFSHLNKALSGFEKKCQLPFLE